MRRVIATERGGALYSKRMSMVEPLFAQIKANRRIDYLKRRGRGRRPIGGRLIAAAHNRLKRYRSGTPRQGPEPPIDPGGSAAPPQTDLGAFARQPRVEAEARMTGR